MYRIDPVDYGNLQSGPCGGLLNLPNYFVPFVDRESIILNVQNRAGPIFNDSLFKLCRINPEIIAFTGAHHSNLKLRHLPDLFFECHLANQAFDATRIIPRWFWCAACCLKEGVAIWNFSSYSIADVPN